KELYAKGGISKKDVEASELDVANAAGALKTANSKVAEAETHLASFNAQLGYAEVRAPFDGVVTEQFLRQGDFAAAGAKLLTVAGPTSAVTLEATNANAGTVMVVDAKSVAHEVHVTIGAHTRERTQIATGLRGGETVVIEGNYGLPDGTKVQIAP